MLPNDFTEKDRKISELLHDMIGDEIIEVNLPKFDEIEKMARKTKRRRNLRKTFLRAACFCLAVLFVSLGFTIWLNSNTAKAIEFELEKILIPFKLGGLTSADQYDIEDKYISVIFDKESDVKKCKKILPNLCLPNYIPERYHFTSLSIEKRENGSFEAYYSYSDQKNELYINIIGGIDHNISFYIEGNTPENDIKEGEPFITEYEEYGIKTAHIIQNEQLISISATSLEEETLLKIAKNME